ncbi:MAG: alkaline phosphatase [Bacteroidales bacterium]|nr:alkaline phosphatase [Bacteroidales bacterium]
MKITRFASAIMTIALIVTAASCTNTSNNDEKAKYIFLFIGDGMGNSHVAVTESYLSYKAGKLGGEQLLMTTFPVFGTCTTHSADKRITDSSAAGTAIATGSKTNNSYLGVDPEGNELESMSFCLQEDGYRIGIISSVPINHATPASFYGHNISRGAYYELMKEIPESGFEYFASAGILQYHGPKDTEVPTAAEYLEANGYDVCFGKAELAEAMQNSDRIVFCQEYNRDMEPKNYDSTGNKPETETTLAEMVQAGIDFLGDEEPFFIMCEGGEIDWASHSDKTMPMIMTTIGFDEAIKAAYDFYLKHPDETLIVVTADHETGGVALGAGNHHGNVNWEVIENAWNESGQSNNLRFDENKALNDEAHIGWTTTDHTGGAVPVYAIGKGAERFAGRIDNTDIKGRILCE